MRILKLMISLVYWLACRAGDSLRRWFGLENPVRRVVLYYHGITEAQRARFRRQMELLRSRTKVVSLTELTSPSGSGCQTCVTFDDGMDSVRRNAVPILVELGLPASVFVVSGNLGRRPQWEVEPGHPDAEETLMTAEQLLELRPNAIAIGSHTVSHPNLVSLPTGEVHRELLQSKRDIQALLGTTVDAVSVPFGEFNLETLQIAQAVGYKAVFTSEPQVTPRGGEPFEVGRFAVSPDDWMLEFWLKASGAYSWRRYARWLRRTVLGLLSQRSPVGGSRHADSRTAKTVRSSGRRSSCDSTVAGGQGP